jgi:hypothetical protein
MGLHNQHHPLAHDPALGGSTERAPIFPRPSEIAILGAMAALMTYLQAAVAVLAQADHPLTSREILDTAVSQGLFAPASRTPLRSLDAALYAAAQRRGSPVRRVFTAGHTRALRGSVHWTLSRE